MNAADADLARRSFDVRLVIATLEYVRGVGEANSVSEFPAVAVRSFKWLNRELGALRAAARLGRREPLAFTETDCANSFRMFEDFFDGWFGKQLEPGGGAPRLIPPEPSQRFRFRAGRERLDKDLSHAYVVERYRLGESGVRRVFVPHLERASHCVAYAIAVLMENRWGVADRMRVCPFRELEGDGFHFFVDLLRDGSVRTGPPQMYCTPKHSATHRKRLQRARQEKAT